MSSSKRVVETVPQISISSVKEYVSHRNPLVQLNLTSSNDSQSPYLVNTTRTKCYFGGSRAWFKCVLCDKRVSVLYLNEDQNTLFCRKCSNLRYRTQSVGGSNRLLMRCFDVDERAGAVFDGLQRVRIWHNDKPTRRFKRFLKYRQRAAQLSKTFIG